MAEAGHTDGTADGRTDVEHVARRHRDRPDRHKPEHRLSQGPLLSSIRAVIKRTSGRSAPACERERDRERDRRRPEITILSAEPLSINSLFPPPPPPPAQIWGPTIPLDVQPPPSYEQVLREKTQEQPPPPPPSTSSSSVSMTTISTQTDTGCQVSKPAPPPRPPFPVASPHVDDIISSSSQPDGGSMAAQTDQWEPAPDARPAPPRPRPRCREVRVQTLVKLRDDGAATLAARGGGQGAGQEGGGASYLQELLEAFSDEAWGPGPRSDGSGLSQSESDEEEEEMSPWLPAPKEIQDACSHGDGRLEEVTGSHGDGRLEEPYGNRGDGHPEKGSGNCGDERPEEDSVSVASAPRPRPLPRTAPPRSKAFWEEVPHRPPVAPRASLGPGLPPAGGAETLQTDDKTGSPELPVKPAAHQAPVSVQSSSPPAPPQPEPPSQLGPDLLSPPTSLTAGAHALPSALPPALPPALPSTLPPALGVKALRKTSLVQTRPETQPPLPPRPLPLRPPPIRALPGRPPPPSISPVSSPAANQMPPLRAGPSTVPANQRAPKRRPPLPPRPRPGHPLYMKQEVLVVLDNPSHAPSDSALVEGSPQPAVTPPTDVKVQPKESCESQSGAGSEVRRSEVRRGVLPTGQTDPADEPPASYVVSQADDITVPQGDILALQQLIGPEGGRGQISVTRETEPLPPATAASITITTDSSVVPLEEPITGELGGVARLLFDFTAENQDEITVKVGDIVTEVQAVDQQWLWEL